MSDPTRTAVERFNEAFNRHDVDAIMNWMTEDCVFENTRPAPDGTRITGNTAVRAFWDDFPAGVGQLPCNLATWREISRMWEISAIQRTGWLA